jgi:septal ring factor EnvC (AmiA/AmiB activator)
MLMAVTGDDLFNAGLLLLLGVIAATPAFVAANTSTKHRRETREDHDMVQKDLVDLKNGVNAIRSDFASIQVDVAETKIAVMHTQETLEHHDRRLAQIEAS